MSIIVSFTRRASGRRRANISRRNFHCS